MKGQDKQQRFIGNKIAMKRVAMNISQEELAERVGISRVSIVRIENGNQIPRTKTATRICEALGMTPDDLYQDYLSEQIIPNVRMRSLIDGVEKLSIKKQEQFYKMAEVILQWLDSEE